MQFEELNVNEYETMFIFMTKPQLINQIKLKGLIKNQT